MATSAIVGKIMASWLVMTGPNVNAVYGPLTSKSAMQPIDVCNAYRKFLGAGLAEAFDDYGDNPSKLEMRIGTYKVTDTKSFKFECVQSDTRPDVPYPFVPWPNDK